MVKDKRGGFVGRLFRGVLLALGALALVVVAVLVLGIGIARYGEQVSWLAPLLGKPTETSSTVVVEDIQRLNELATAKLIAQVAVTERENGPGWASYLPEGVRETLTEEEVILMAVGEVRAGVNLDELGEDDVRVDGEKVTIALPEARTLSVALDEERTGLYDRDRGLLRIRGDDALLEEARDDAIPKIEAAAEENDLLEQAQSNAEDGIKTLVTTLGYEEVAFE
ncbi:MAG: DUF4230 domain-containing protein [Actinomycetota bacterium]|nr:DUF4230 domain-containing protein [Actinomycetota bacterium]